MQRQTLFNTILLVATVLVTSCNEDDDSARAPLEKGATVEIRNTLQIAADPAQGGTGGNELPVETVLGAPEGAYNLSSTISEDIEFDDYLEGLYDIDLSTSEIRFTLVATANDPIYSNFFRTIEAGTFDRYYLTFPDGHNITSSISTNNSVDLIILSSNEIAVVIGEGWDFNPDSTFTITLN